MYFLNVAITLFENPRAFSFGIKMDLSRSSKAAEMFRVIFLLSISLLTSVNIVIAAVSVPVPY
jgi:hypothetical protein